MPEEIAPPSQPRPPAADGADLDALDPFRRLVAIMARLRGPGGCPWDREQSHRSLTPYLIEEAYEVKETIDRGDFEELRAELGDLVLQVVFHAQLAAEAGRFDIDDVMRAIGDKLIRRHPHVFGDVEVSGSGEVLRNWEDIKKQEKADRQGNGDATAETADAGAAPFESMLSGVPRSLPALLKAHRIQQKVAGVGFDWATLAPVWDKLHEEIDELRQALETDGGASDPAPGKQAAGPDREAVANEIGDILFSVANLARKLGVPAEEALDRTNHKFMARFRYIEETLHGQGRKPSDMTLEELDALWEAAKACGL